MNIFGIGLPELLLIGVVAMIVFGPERLPEIMGQVGRAIAEFRKITGELSSEFNRTIQTEIDQTRAVVDSTRAVVEDATATLRTTSAPRPTSAPVPVTAVSPAATTNGATGTAVQTAPEPSSSWAWEASPGTTASDGSHQTSPPRQLAGATDDLLPPY